MAVIATSTVRLQVERDPTGSELVNQVVNPDGTLGGWGYTTPVVNTQLGKQVGATPSVLEFTTTPSQACRLFTNPVYISPGQWVAARWTEPPNTQNGHRAQIVFFDGNGAQISATAQTVFMQAAGTAARTIAAVQAPAGTVTTRLRFDIYKDATNANPLAGTRFRFTDVVMAVAATAAPLTFAAMAGIPTAYFTNVLPACTEVVVDRAMLEVGTLTARVLGAAYDPATSPTLRPGRQVILEALVAGVWVPLFTGRTTSPRTVYVPTETGVETVTTLTAVDVAGTMATQVSTQVMLSIPALNWIYEKATLPFPWLIDGRNNQEGMDAAFVQATDTGATLLDWTVRVRDTYRGLGWVSRAGVVTVWDDANLPATVLDTITDGDYNEALALAYDTAQAVNAVTITNWNGAAATTYGPYRNAVSVRKWGELPATFTTVGLAAPGGSFNSVTTLANEILAAGANPALAPESVTVGLKSPALVDRWAGRDLGDLLTFTCTTPAVSAAVRISRIQHVITAGDNITGDRWLTTYGLMLNGRPAVPTT
jgi:hypothetical protein